jgi:hypothetical protein
MVSLLEEGAMMKLVG